MERIEYELPKNAIEKYNDFLKRSVWTILFILFIILVSVSRLYTAQLPYKGLWIVIASLIFLGHIILIVRKIHRLGDTVEKLQIIEGEVYMKLLGYKDQPDKLLRLAKDRSVEKFRSRSTQDATFVVLRDHKKAYELEREGLRVYVIPGEEDKDLVAFLESIEEKKIKA